MGSETSDDPAQGSIVTELHDETELICMISLRPAYHSDLHMIRHLQVSSSSEQRRRVNQV